MTPILRREWATPLTIGTFTLMALTGLAMFFHIETPLQKEVHEWAGWLMVAGVVLHVTVNWMAFKRYFQTLPRGLAIVAMFGLFAVGTFFVRGAADPGAGSPPAVAINALLNAPISQVAPLFGKTPQEARDQLAAKGIVLTGDEMPLTAATQGNRERIGQALGVLAER